MEKVEWEEEEEKVDGDWPNLEVGKDAERNQEEQLKVENAKGVADQIVENQESEQLWRPADRQQLTWPVKGIDSGESQQTARNQQLVETFWMRWAGHVVPPPMQPIRIWWPRTCSLWSWMPGWSLSMFHLFGC